MATAARMTPDGLLRMPDDGRIYELVDGELLEIGMSTKASVIGVKILSRLERYIEATNAGYLLGIDAGYMCFPDSPEMVRKPDGSFIAADRMTPDEYEEDGWTKIVPDFVIEVNSPSDKIYDIIEKRELWLDIGVRLVWIVDPADDSVTAFLRDGASRRYLSTDTITGDPVLPGFQCLVGEFFQTPHSKS